MTKQVVCSAGKDIATKTPGRQGSRTFLLCAASCLCAFVARKELGNFYDKEEEYKSALYILNPEYFKQNTNQPAKPIFMEVQFRYEISADKGFSKRLIDNFEKNFDMVALRKMVE